MGVNICIRASVVVRYSHPHDVKSPSPSNSKGVKNDRSNRVRSGLPKCWRAADNAICGSAEIVPESVERFQMPRETRGARLGLTRVGDAGPSVHSIQKGLVSKEGEYWTVGYGRNSFRLKDSKRLGYPAHLLRHPGVEFHLLNC